MRRRLPLVLMALCLANAISFAISGPPWGAVIAGVVLGLVTAVVIVER